MKRVQMTGIVSGNKPYTAEDDELLRAQFPTANLFVLAARMGRSIGGISVRASALKIRRVAKLPQCAAEQISQAEQDEAFASMPIWRRAVESMPELQRVQTQWRSEA